MFIHQSYEKEFYHLLLDLKETYGESMFKLEGIDEDSLDIVKYSKTYFKKSNGKTVADHTVDPNSNVQIRNIATYKTESIKGIEKLNSMYLLWKTARSLYNTKEANNLMLTS